MPSRILHCALLSAYLLTGCSALSNAAWAQDELLPLSVELGRVDAFTADVIAEDFHDASFIAQLDRSGYIDGSTRAHPLRGEPIVEAGWNIRSES